MVNPYLPPTTTVQLSSTRPRFIWKTGAAAFFVAIVGGLLLGAATNSVNGSLSPQYFRGVMGWQTPHILAASIAQGALEGSIYAVLGTILLLAIILIFTPCVLTTRIVVRLQASAFALVGLLWLVGGATAVVIAAYFPEMCSPRYFGYSTLWPNAGYYAWVRGSIWGSVYGAFPAVILSMILNCSLLRKPTAS